MSGEQAAGLGMGLFACILGAAGIYAAIRRRGRRAEIATTSPSTGGIVSTVGPGGCSCLLLAGGRWPCVVALVFKGCASRSDTPELEAHLQRGQRSRVA